MLLKRVAIDTGLKDRLLSSRMIDGIIVVYFTRFNEDGLIGI
jgi:hypothetical protein